jgi:sulfopropanediol 3-dehydrogenase
VKYLKKASPKKEEDLSSVSTTVSEIIKRVREEGEAAVRYYSEKFDGWNPTSFKLSSDEINNLISTIPDDLKNSIKFLYEQVKNFAELQKRTLINFEVETLPGVFLGQKYIPIDSVGVYIPGGRYSLIASAIMSIVPAKVAGVRRVVACVPPRGGKLNPATIFAAHLAGADEIFTIGGAQAIAAMAYGLKDLMEPVDMISGPGNKYVTEAKRQLFGKVGIDLLAGPTEIGIIADETADPVIVAADIVGQAEHDPDSSQFLITLSENLGQMVMKEIERQLEGLETAEIARASWSRNGEVVVASSMEEAALISDSYAPEHLEVHTKDPRWFLERLKNYGSLFLGEEAGVVFSDKADGTNHILPTGGAARYTGGLWVGKYMKNVTYQWMNKRGSLLVAPHAAKIARAEGMIAHALSAEIRVKKYTG